MSRSLLRRRLFVFPCALVAWLVSAFFIEYEFFLSRIRFGDPSAWQTEKLIDIVLFVLFMVVALFITGLPRLNGGTLLKPPAVHDVTDYELDKYAGFIASKRDFKCRLRRGPTIYYRVNSDGSLVNLRRWHFDEETGEFLLVRSRNSGRVIFSTKPYTKRYTAYHEHNYKRFLYAGIILVCAIFFFTAAQDFGLLRYHQNYSFTTSLVNAALVVVPFGLLLFALVYSVIKPKAIESWVVGPEPLKAKPRSAPATSGDDSIDDLDYRRSR